MPYLFLLITREKWSFPGELQADALTDMAVRNNLQQNTLRVWHIDDDKSNLQRVVDALFHKGDMTSATDYALVDLQTLQAEAFQIKQAMGTTKDTEVNGCCRHITGLNAHRLFRLAQIVQAEV